MVHAAAPVLPARGPLPPVVLALAYHTWADARGRQMSWSPDRVAAGLLADTEIPAVLVANPLRSQLARLRTRDAEARAGFPTDPTRHLVLPRRWRRQDSADVGRTVRQYRRLDAWLHARAERAGLQAPVLVSCHPVLAAEADPDRWADVVYYGWDDWLTYPKNAHLRALVRHSFDRMAEHGVNVVGVTDAVVERVGSPRGSTVPNAVNAADHEATAPVPGWFADLEGPVALYVGALQERVDTDALTRLARDLPDWTVVLVGPLQEPDRFAELARLDNVLVRPPEPRAVALALMAGATVCLIPHRPTPMAQAMSPLKLYEYLASGARVVATDLGPMRGVSEAVTLLPHGAPFAPAVLAAAAAGRPDAASVAAFLAEHDWGARYAQWRRAALGR